jgi:hypothetical protein
VTSISPTINRSFTGNLEIDGQPVPATVQVTDGGVSLVVGGDIVGTWATDEIEFAGIGQGYELRAEGDAIKFLPDGPEEFGAFVSGRPTEPAPDPSPAISQPPDPSPTAPSPPAGTETPDPGHPEPPDPVGMGGATDLDVDRPLEPSLPFDDEDDRPDLGLPFDDEDDRSDLSGLFGSDEEAEKPSDLTPSFGQDEDESVSDLAPSFGRDEAPEPEITWETNPDEEFAAGFNGTPTDMAPPPFRSAFTAPSEPPVDAADATWEIPARTAEPAPAQSPAHEERSRPEPEVTDETVDTPEGEERTRVWESVDHGWDTPVEQANPTREVPAVPTASTDESPAKTPALADEIAPLGEEPESAPDVPVASALEEEPSAVAAEPEDEPDSAGPSTAARAVTAARGLIAGLRERRQSPDTEESDETPIPTPAHDDTPQPIDDGENLRQWGLVVAGAAVLLVLVGIVTWGLASMLGGDDPLEVDAEPPPTTAAVAAPAPTVEATTTTTVAPPTTVSPENEAAAEQFVGIWNNFATKYAYHLSISADSVPISVAPAPTVHLTYDEAGVLRLNMVPKGTGSDRDILLAMGLAVAWGDPTLSPEARKEVLGAMGVNVDDPQLGEMGGTLTRNGVSYDARVVDGLIQFEVAPSA